MSKENALRAMREARWAEAQKRTGAAAPRRPVAPARERTVETRATGAGASGAKGKAAAASSASPAASADALCGHRNMSGRTCTREAGHPQKSHRYG